MMAWPIGMIGAPNRPWPMRNSMSASRLVAKAHRNDDTVKPSTEPNITLRQPSRFASQPTSGVPIAVAMRLNVITQAI